ncbi:MAG: hypothetical protein CSA95_03810 [Bacteroidetes bacterium]|nr:MAG: hypothetical protein CSA95_03810 [Bacteroidota bacterium]PIE87971.1 MAG: hypothetical protein CSA04_04290 [Bacteroidota bacterium]
MDTVLKSTGKHPEQLLFLLLAAIGFFIPLYSPMAHGLTYIVFLFFILFIILRRKVFPSPLPKAKILTLLGIGLFLLTLCYLFFTQNKKEVYIQLDQFTAILVFPLLLLIIPSRQSFTKPLYWITNLFVLGTLLSTLKLFIQALYRYQESGDIVELYYINLGNGIHPSYMSIMVLLSLAILLERPLFAKRKEGSTSLLYQLPLIIWLLLFNTLLASKAGILTEVIILMLYIVKSLLHRRYVKAFAIGILTTFFTATIPFLFPFTKERILQFNESISSSREAKRIAELDQMENSRVVGWRVAIQLIKKHPLWGVGPGDIGPLINEASEKRYRVTDGFRNPHNQYLQTWLEQGLLGLIILISIGIISLIMALQDRNYLHMAFLILLFSHMLFESILERRLGIITFSFWNSLFWIKNLSGKRRDIPVERKT